MTRLATIAIFFFSGVAALVYQVVWMRELGLVFGITTYAVATVLAIFMGGLALGSHIFGSLADSQRSPLRSYALLEVAIGAYALVVPWLLHALRPLYIGLAHLEPPFLLLSAGRAALAVLVLLPPTTLMGGTFPFLVRYFVRRRSEVGGSAAVLYFINTAGALVGTLAAGFWLLEHFGLSGTTRIAAAVSIGAGLAALLLDTLSPASQPSRAEAAQAETADAASAVIVSPRAIQLALLAIGISGFASLAYEVVWTRALLRYLYNSTYAFTTMLAVFLGGLAVGSALHGAFLRGSRRPLFVFAALEAGVGIFFLVAALLFPHLPDISSAALGSTTVGSFGQSVTMMFIRATLILFPAAVCLGATLPLATEVCAQSLAQLGKSVGRVYAVNTVGAILGSLAGGFVLIPLIGMQGTLYLLVAINIALAVLLVAAEDVSRGLRIGVGAGIVLAAVAVAAVVPRDLFRRTFGTPTQEIIFYHEGVTDTVGVAQAYSQRVILYDDQRGTAGTNSYRENFLLGNFPMLLHTGTPKIVMHICFGVGNSLSAVAAHEELVRVDNVELSPHVLDAAKYFWTNNGVLQNPKVRTIIDDGRNQVLSTRETYDVIMLEPPELFTAGVINLYTRDFYEDAKAHLAEDGLFMQWINYAASPLEEEKRFFKAFTDVFPHVTAWRLLEGGPIMAIGSKSPITIDYQRLKKHIQEPNVLEDMTLSGYEDVDHFLALFLFDDKAFREFAGDVEPLNDDHTALDFSMPRYLGSGFGLGTFNFKVIQDGQNPFGPIMQRAGMYFSMRRPVAPLLTNLGDETPEQVQARIEKYARLFVPHAKHYSEAEWPRRKQK